MKKPYRTEQKMCEYAYTPAWQSMSFSRIINIKLNVTKNECYDISLNQNKEFTFIQQGRVLVDDSRQGM